MNKNIKIILIILGIFIIIVPVLLVILFSFTTKPLMSSIESKSCCMEIGGTVSNNKCTFNDLDGTKITVKLSNIGNDNGKNYCTDEYINRK